MAEWRWGFDSHGRAGAYEPPSQDPSPPLIVGVAAAVIFALLLLL